MGIDRLVEIVAAAADRVGTHQVGPCEHARRRVGLTQDHRLPATDDAGLLGADCFAVFAQPFGMVDVHSGDHGHIGVDDVDRIQATAQTHFQNRQVQPGVGEQLQRGQRAVLEIGQRGLAACGLDGVERSNQRRIVHVLAVDAHALVVAQQMRRGVCANLPAGGTCNGFDEGDGRALAVGATNHDGALARRPRPIAVATARALRPMSMVAGCWRSM